MKSLKQIFIESLQIDEDSIGENISREDTDYWDSFNHLLLMNNIEKNYGIKFTFDEIVAIKTFNDLQFALQNKNIDIN